MFNKTIGFELTLVSKEQKKIERVINFMKKGLQSLADELEETVKGINDFIKSLNKALKDLKEIEVPAEAVIETPRAKKAVASVESAKSVAANTLFNLLSGGAKRTSPASTGVFSAPSAPTSGPATSEPPQTTASKLPAPPTLGAPKAPSGPPKAPSGPPKAPSGPPKAPSGPPKKPGLPPAPKVPPAAGSAPPKATSVGPVQTPTFVKKPSPPSGPPSGPPGAPARPPGPSSAPSATRPSGGLSSLRDEMLEELNRLKRIMRGE